MASQIEICNQAISKANGNSIQALTEKSIEAGICNTFYNTVRRGILREHSWNFATAVQKLAVLPDETVFGKWTTAAQLPSDCLKIIKLLPEYGIENGEYEIMSGKLYCTQSTPVLKYVKDVTDPNAYDSLFIEVFSLKLASELAFKLSTATQLRTNLLQEYERAFAKARKLDANESKKETRKTILSARD